MEIKDMIELMKAVSDNALTSFELEQGDTKITMKREKKLVQPTVVAVESQGGVYTGVPAGAGAQPMTGVQMLAGVQPMAGVQMLAGTQPLAGVQSLTGGAGIPAAGSEAHSQVTGDISSDKVVECPLVGTFYSSPSPEAEDFVKVGDTVKKGQILGIVEAMKLMNEIECEFDGIVDAVLVKNEEVVEYGQPLFRIR